jgi:hypothetical protein
MVIKYTKIFYCKTHQNLPKIGIFGLKTNHLANLVYVGHPLTAGAIAKQLAEGSSAAKRFLITLGLMTKVLIIL